MNACILRLYKDMRRMSDRGRPISARRAYVFACDAFAKGKKGYVNDWPWQRGAHNVTRQQKKRPSDNYAWIEDTESAGLRFVGYADEICKSIDHRGWYTDEDGDCKTYRGAVWQLPARRGIERFIAGYEDPNNKGAAFVDLDILSGNVIGFSPNLEEANEEAKQLAAYNADSIAERNAEREREYNAAWHAGSEWSYLADEIARERKDALALLVESRPERHATRETATPRMCAAIRAAVLHSVDAIAKMRKKRAELFEQYGDADGFAEFLPRG